MKKKSMWLVYDFDLGGDYEGLYTWLDSKGAIECGNGVAFLNFQYKDTFYREFIADLQNSIDIQKKDRIYIIYRDAKKMRGKFVNGDRKRNPWAGYTVEGVEEEYLVEEE